MQIELLNQVVHDYVNFVSTSLPAIYLTSSPTSPWQVTFTDPKRGRIRRHFKIEKEARKYHAQLLKKAKISGTVGLVMDVTMRDQYFAAVKALGGVSLASAVRFYLKHHPPGRENRPLLELVELFLDEKRQASRSPRTIKTLRSRLMMFLAESTAEKVADLTQDTATQFMLDLKGTSVTRRNYQTDISSFCRWLVRRKILVENPFQDLERPQIDAPTPRIATPCEARDIMRAAVAYRGGIYALYYAILLFAGLRPGEAEHLSWADIQSESIRVRLGKKRGRRSVRVVPIVPCLAAWLAWGRDRELIPQPIESARYVRESIEGFAWQNDICRHSWISYRLAEIHNENQVAREAGTSPEMIYRYYYDLVDVKSSTLYFAMAPDHVLVG